MHGRGMAKSPIPPAVHERQVIVPRGEIQRRVECATERCERSLGAVENFSSAGLQTSGERRGPCDGGKVDAPRRQHLQRQRTESARSAMHEHFLFGRVLTREAAPRTASHIVTKL